MAGLLGVGGGIVLVPLMVAIFPTVGVPAQYVQQMALGTSLASIMLTVNGAAALNLLGCGAGRLEKGGPADFCVLPENLTY